MEEDWKWSKPASSRSEASKYDGCLSKYIFLRFLIRMRLGCWASFDVLSALLDLIALLISLPCLPTGEGPFDILDPSIDITADVCAEPVVVMLGDYMPICINACQRPPIQVLLSWIFLISLGLAKAEI
jgi:hypothetical protein